MIAERPFGAQFVKIDVALKNDLAGSGNFKINRLALDQLHRSSAKKAGNQIFFNIRGSGNDGGESNGRVGPDGNSNFHFARGITGKDLAAGSAGH